MPKATAGRRYRIATFGLILEAGPHMVRHAPVAVAIRLRMIAYRLVTYSRAGTATAALR